MCSLGAVPPIRFSVVAFKTFQTPFMVPYAIVSEFMDQNLKLCIVGLGLGFIYIVPVELHQFPT